jgi:hypothetical protein
MVDPNNKKLTSINTEKGSTSIADGILWSQHYWDLNELKYI